MSETLRRTPLFDFHVRHGGRIVPFAGWEMPVQYGPILDEHRAVREAAGLFDVSHMGEVRVTGARAGEYLDSLVPNDVSAATDGKAVYSCLCHPHGGCVDDLIIYRISADNYFICVNAGNKDKDFTWIRDHAAGFGVTVTDESDAWGQLALQGPKAHDILETLTSAPIRAIKRFGFAIGIVAGVECIISRTGYTGEDGFELYCPAASADALAEAVFNAGTPLGLKLAGLGCRDSLRLEAGYPLYGHEITDSITPLEGGLAWTVKLGKKADFIGRSALQAQKDAGVPRRLVHFILNDRRIARGGTPVLVGGKVVGEVVSGTLSPLLNQPIGAALIASSANDAELVVDLRGNLVPLVVKKAPLHK